ncbi:MAG: hypothetical protein JST95_05280 [Bacteroidetes bacterium]|nr:hypothetical protein [Bacteroidota bacterium]
MPNRSADILFQLIKSLQKAEKRNFKLFITRSSGNKDLKIVELFDALDKLPEYEETQLLKRVNSIKKPQLANLKAHLYKEILASLRLLNSKEGIDLNLHEQLDFARILYNKGLYLQALKILDKTKELARNYHQDSFLIQVISLEKKIETLHITRSMQNRADQLSLESEQVNERRQNITHLSNLALQLYSWYIRNGHARNEKDEEGVISFFQKHFPPGAHAYSGFYERLYLFQSFSWYAFIRQDFLMYYKYTKKWVDLFYEEPLMIEVETAHYIKGMHNLLNAHFDLRNYIGFHHTLNQFKAFGNSAVANAQENSRVQTFVYIRSAQLNLHILEGRFNEGLKLVPIIENEINQYRIFLDRHRILVFNYKVAMLYFGYGDFEKSIDYLQKIINENVDLRIDLQCYARLLHLLAHYELGNFELVEYLTRSVYRFMAKMENLTVIEEAMFKFIRSNFYVPAKKLQPAFAAFLTQIKQLENSRFQTRTFAYLDVISWVESKVENKSMSEIIRQKYQADRRIRRSGSHKPLRKVG